MSPHDVAWHGNLNRISKRSI